MPSKNARFLPVSPVLLFPLSTLFIALSLNAQETDATNADNNRKGDISFSVGERIEVTAKASADASRMLTSVDRLSGDAVRQPDIDYAWQLAGRMPGVVLTEFNQGTTSGKLSFRGFNGEGEVNAAKLLIDDIPSNANSGNMPYLDMILPIEISTLELVRGTTDPRYGLHNIAGNVNFITRTGGDYTDARLSAGSFGKYDVQAALGNESGDFSQNYAIGYREGDGYRDHGEFDRTSLAGKWGYAISSTLSANASARYYDSDAQEAGYLTREIAYSNPRATNDYNASDMGTREMQQYSLGLHGEPANNITYKVTSWLNKLEDDRYVTFSAGVSQQNRYTEEEHYGVQASATYTVHNSGLSGLFFEAGASIEGQDNISARYLSTNRIADTQTRDQHFRLRVKGAYIQSEIAPADWLRITPAWRVDKVTGDFEDRLNNVTAPVNDYGTISQPKLSVAVLPTDAITLFANWGETFQIGVGSGAYLIPPRQTNLEPSVNRGWEAGLAYKPDAILSARLTLWNQTASGELKRRLNDPNGDFENLGATERQGIDLQGAWSPSKDFSLWATLAWQQAEIETPSPDQPELAGNDIDHVPEWVYSAGADYYLNEEIMLSAVLRGQTDYELNSANNAGTFGDFTLLNLLARYRVSENTDVMLELKNVTDEYYEYVWWDGSQSLHSPGEGRAVAASVMLKF